MKFQFVHAGKNKAPIPSIGGLFHLRSKIAKRFAADICRSASDGVGLPRNAGIILTFHEFLQSIDLLRYIR